MGDFSALLIFDHKGVRNLRRVQLIAATHSVRLACQRSQISDR